MQASQNHQFGLVKQEPEEPSSSPLKSNGLFYEVEKILAMEKGKQNRYFYLVKWENWPIKDCTWEPEDNLEQVCDLVQSFLKARKQGKCDFNWRNHRSLVRLYNSNVKPSKNRKVAEPKDDQLDDFQGTCKPTTSKINKSSLININIEQSISEENQKTEQISRTQVHQSSQQHVNLFKKQAQSSQKRNKNNKQGILIAKQQEESISQYETVQQKEDQQIILQQIVEESQNIKLFYEQTFNNEREKLKIEENKTKTEESKQKMNGEVIKVLQFKVNGNEKSLEYKIKENGVERWIKPHELSLDLAISLVKFYQKTFIFK